MLADSVGFEPTLPLTALPVLKTGALPIDANYPCFGRRCGDRTHEPPGCKPDALPTELIACFKR